MSFTFKQFCVDDTHCAMKIGTDGVLLGAWADVEGASTILDVGAGSGLISLMMAQRTKADTLITGIEKDSEAAADMMRNFASSTWADRLTALQGDFKDFVVKVDLIVSNPPFFTGGPEACCASRAMARHGDGLNPYTLIDFGSRYLGPDGTLAMITDFADHANITYHAEMSGLKIRRCAEVISRHGTPPFRMLWQMRRQDGPIEREKIIIRGADGLYSDRYRSLTREFYLNFQ